MQLPWGARSSRTLPSASRRRAGHNHLVPPFSEWILPSRLFGETPNRATETVALPFSDCMVPLSPARRARSRRPGKVRGRPLAREGSTLQTAAKLLLLELKREKSAPPVAGDSDAVQRECLDSFQRMASRSNSVALRTFSFSFARAQ